MIANPSLRVLGLCGDFNGCTWWRVQRPMEELTRQGYRHCAWANKDDARLQDYIHLYDAVVLPRMSWVKADRPGAERWKRALHRAGLAIIGEVDDDLFSPGINARLKATTEPHLSMDELEERRLDRLASLEIVDGLIVSSRRLKTIMRDLLPDDKPICVVENAIDARYWHQQRRLAKRVVPGPTVGWAGGSRPDHDLEPVARAWGQLAQVRPQVTFVVYGYQPPEFGRHVPAHRLVRIPWQPAELYPQPYRNIDIGCATVALSLWNTCKTPIKVWEYALGGAAVVANPSLYGRAVTHGEDGLLAETADEWLAALRSLVDDEVLRRRLRKAQRARTVAGHSLEKNARRWPEAWETIVADFRARQARPSILLPAGVGA